MFIFNFFVDYVVHGEQRKAEIKIHFVEDIPHKSDLEKTDLRFIRPKIVIY